MTTKEKLFNFVDSLNIQTTRQTPSQWAEQNRIITSGSNHKGRWSYNLTPYTREIVDRLSPDDPCRVIALQAGSQLGKSHGFIFNGIGYLIKNKPTNIFLTAGDDDLVKDSMNKIDEMIQNSGLKHLIRPNVLKKSNQKSGDTDREKQFVGGGQLILQSIKAPDKIKQNSYEYIFLDDIESAVRTNSKNVGDIVNLATARATSYGDTYKLCLVGVPEIKQTSIIEPAFLKGDQRKFFLPCPCCGEYIEIVWRKKLSESDEYAGVVFQTDNVGKLIESSVGYVCQNCGGFFQEAKKQEMLMNGKWQPTATPINKTYTSYHLPALLSPRGFFNWTHYANLWLEIFPTQGVVLEEKLQHFKNHVLAESYEKKKKEVNATLISRNIRDYEIGTIPTLLSESDGNGKIALITCACDLNGFEDDARLDYEILAHSTNGSTYSVDHGSIGTFQRDTSKENRETYTYFHGYPNNVWDLFRNVINKEYPTSTGEIMKIAIVGVDTGAFTTLAYQFVDSGIIGKQLVALKGDPIEKSRRLDSDTKTFKEGSERANLFWVQGNQIKDTLSEHMKLRYQKGYPQPAGFMNYPSPTEGKYDYRYFDEYEGEVRRPVMGANGIEMAFAWEKKNQQSKNHFWDCRVYNMCLRDIFVKILAKRLGKPLTWNDFCMIVG